MDRNTLVKKADTAAALALPAKEFLAEYSPLAVPAKTADIRSPVAASQCGLPSISQIKAQYGEKVTVLYLTTWLDNLTAFLGKKYALTEVQTVETANLIYQRYPELNIADLRLVFESIKTGDCGITLYGDINGLTILKIFETYFTNRLQQCYDASLNRDEVIKKHGYDRTKTTATEQQVADMYNRYREAYIKRQEEKEAQYAATQVRIKEILKQFK
ncbi:MAG: hypothetical protein IKQ70_10075 [Bacteroidales bacterium]|nr:hypothetical protein [Bacteroidales bacterium]